jgi:hypothetical protein
VPVDSLAAMQLPKLTALSLGHWPTELLDHDLEGQAKERQQQRQHHAMLKTLLPRLPQLQFLWLTGIGIAASVNVHLSGLQQLQSCFLAACCISKDSLHGLCSKLTSLQLRHCRDASCFAAVVHVPTAGWPLLQQLCITNMPLPPAVLTQLTALEVLKLTRCGLKPSQRVSCWLALGSLAVGVNARHPALNQPPFLTHSQPARIVRTRNLLTSDTLVTFGLYIHVIRK